LLLFSDIISIRFVDDNHIRHFHNAVYSCSSSPAPAIFTKEIYHAVNGSFALTYANTQLVSKRLHKG
jgi:hypothetical protein